MYIDKKFWKNKRVLVTGHTGFKGGWLSVFLKLLGCKVSGLALDPVGKNNFFKCTKIKKIFKNDLRQDICDKKKLKKAMMKIKPEIVFHLAAQSSVIESFKDPSNTVVTNVMGTASLLDELKFNKKIKSIIIVTTDKVYQNYKTKKYFDENSILGGDDVYSGSKASCEIITNSFRESFYKNSQCNIATVRAGNCFGGGDWTQDRIVKDSLENFYKNKELILRKPDATRPWQHVIEPIFGYVLLAQRLSSKKGKKFAKAWNFGPSSRQNMKVAELVNLFKRELKSKSKIIINRNFKKINNKIHIFESKDLSINSNKVFKALNWKPKMSVKKAVIITVEWYLAFTKKKDLLAITRNQILSYLNKV